MSNYSNLPGVNTNVKDGQMLITEDNTTNSMLIIGEVKANKRVTDNLPEDAVLVRSEEELFENYGRYFFEGQLNPLAAEWKVAKDAGVRNTYLLALKGDTVNERFVYLQDMMYNVVADYGFSHIILAGMYADQDLYDLTLADFKTEEGEEVDNENLEGMESYQTITGSKDATTLTLGEGNATVKLIVNDGQEEHEVEATIVKKTTTPYDLINHLTKEFKKALSQIGLDIGFEMDIADGKVIIRSYYEVNLEGDEVLSALGIELQKPEKKLFGNPARLLGDFAEQQTLESGTVIVYIGTQPVNTTDKKVIRRNVEYLSRRNNDISKHVQVVAGPQVGVNIPGSLRTQWLSGVTHYATLVNSLAVQHAPTNQPLRNVNALRYNLSLRQLDSLTGNKYVTFRSKNNRIVVVDGVTTAPDIFAGLDIVHSDFRRLTTLRSTSYMVSAIREVTDPFIGRPNEFPTYNAMNTAVRGVINQSIDKGVIQDAVYSIKLGNNLDVASIDLTILPQFELRKIDVVIGLSNPQGFEAISQ